MNTANLSPPSTFDKEDMDSYMYQTVGMLLYHTHENIYFSHHHSINITIMITDIINYPYTDITRAQCDTIPAAMFRCTIDTKGDLWCVSTY
jgi:hypothetical protein